MSTLPVFDEAAALYREPAVGLYYLDDDPVAAAQSVCDAHVPLGITSAVNALSSAWHVPHNPMFQAIDAKVPYEHLLRRRTPVAGSGQRTLQPDAPDPFYEEFSGSSPYYLLCGQRIAGNDRADATTAEWVRATAGNYVWTRRYGLALAAEHRARWGKPHPQEPMLWTLELLPPGLEGDQTAPTPDVAPECRVIVDGCYDTVASYRAHYVAHKQALLKWTKRAPPSWLVFDEEERCYALNNSVQGN